MEGAVAIFSATEGATTPDGVSLSAGVSVFSATEGATTLSAGVAVLSATEGATTECLGAAWPKTRASTAGDRTALTEAGIFGTSMVPAAGGGRSVAADAIECSSAVEYSSALGGAAADAIEFPVLSADMIRGRNYVGVA